MKKIIKLLIFITIIFTITGCSNKYNIKKLNNNVLQMFYDYNYVDESLNNKEKSLINKFKEEQDSNNLVIELNSYFIDSNKTTEKDTDGVWEENGIYYIKYSDLDFEEVDINSVDIGYSHRAYIVCNGYNIEIIKESITILYQDTKDSDDYKYAYLGSIKNDGETDEYFQSYYNSTGLIIRYIYDGNNITDIKLTYEPYTSYVKQSTTDNNLLLKVVYTITLSIGLIIALIFIIKKVRLSNLF